MAGKICRKCFGLGETAHSFTVTVEGTDSAHIYWLRCPKCDGRGYVLIKPYLNKEEREAVRMGTTRGHIVILHFEFAKLKREICRALTKLRT